MKLTLLGKYISIPRIPTFLGLDGISYSAEMEVDILMVDMQLLCDLWDESGVE